ncbi:LAME_0A02806g1_1 [Lachancea meyersii CBS 8951]|uniref:LAME_0A02806g1_1 n=1 Tax=Lachancea meyersii CBS 8951 TaxID=1266667 RepID=A0A1G4IMX5_9SACH|nr:LAME_0A02806g1_1 [Lachancea meyersii CBS 8951]
MFIVLFWRSKWRKLNQDSEFDGIGSLSRQNISRKTQVSIVFRAGEGRKGGGEILVYNLILHKSWFHDGSKPASCRSAPLYICILLPLIYVCARTRACTHTRARTRARTSTHTRARARTRACTRTHDIASRKSLSARHTHTHTKPTNSTRLSSRSVRTTPRSTPPPQHWHRVPTSTTKTRVHWPPPVSVQNDTTLLT